MIVGVLTIVIHNTLEIGVYVFFNYLFIYFIFFYVTKTWSVVLLNKKIHIRTPISSVLCMTSC